MGEFIKEIRKLMDELENVSNMIAESETLQEYFNENPHFYDETTEDDYFGIVLKYITDLHYTY